MERTRECNVFEAGAVAQSCDEWPLVPAGVEPQVELSRHLVPEPFFQVLDHDSVLAVMAGDGRVEFRDSNVLWESLRPGDFVYVPAGTAHRVAPETELLTIRFAAAARERQAVAWYCESCGAEVGCFAWDASEALPQEGFLAAAEHHAREIAGRACSRCGAAPGALDLAPFRWSQLASDLREGAAGVEVRPTSRPERSEKHPLLVNAFERLQIANVQLVPLFPYVDDGAMVPGAALFRGREGVDIGAFYHFNTVDEVALTIASSGGYAPTGLLTVNGRMHPVAAPLLNPSDEDSYALMVITQRQAFGPAEEAILFRCASCKHQLFRRDYDASPASALGVPFPMFPSQPANAVFIAEYNAGDRTCAKCGTLNAEFPADLWGVNEYTLRGNTANVAYSTLLEAGRALQPT